MFDYHMHSRYSADCEAAPEDMVRAAIQQGLTEICFTDHIDYDYPDPAFRFDFNREEQEKELSALAVKYADRCKISRGVEIGLQPHLTERYRRLIHTEPFQFVICSLHTVRKAGLHSGDVFIGTSLKEAFEAYYQELLDCLKDFRSYHILGHLDLIKRYAGQQPNEQFHECIREIFQTIIPDGKGIEINTSGFRYGLPSAMPSRDILELYLCCGGEILTIGSDAHHPKDVGYRVRESLQLAADIGFRYVTAFEDGEPVFHSIDRLLTGYTRTT